VFRQLFNYVLGFSSECEVVVDFGIKILSGWDNWDALDAGYSRRSPSV
jgi:hypothetical protein